MNAQGVPAALKEESAPDANDRSKPTVLIVDDARLARLLAAFALRDVNCRIIEATDGADGLAKARVYRPAVIITDALMPKLDGRLLCEAVKADPQLKGTKVIVVSALYKSARYMTEARAAFKVDAYIAKPVDAAELRALVVGFLEEQESTSSRPGTSANRNASEL